VPWPLGWVGFGGLGLVGLVGGWLSGCGSTERAQETTRLGLKAGGGVRGTHTADCCSERAKRHVLTPLATLPLSLAPATNDRVYAEREVLHARLAAAAAAADPTSATAAAAAHPILTRPAAASDVLESATAATAAAATAAAATASAATAAGGALGVSWLSASQQLENLEALARNMKKEHSMRCFNVTPAYKCTALFPDCCC